MCFTPLASILTAATEFSVAGYLWKTISSKRLFPSVVFVFLLGLYQLTEFMLCTSENIVLWAKIGFATYTLLPAVMYHAQMNLARRTIRKEVYLLAAAFSGLALFYPSFIISGGCNLLHVSIKSLIFDRSTFLMIGYLAYYIIYPGLGFIAFTNAIKKEHPTVSLSAGVKVSIFLLPLAILLSQFYFLSSMIINIDSNTSWVTSTVLVIVSGILICGVAAVTSLRKTALFVWAMQCVIASSIGTPCIYPSNAPLGRR